MHIVLLVTGLSSYWITGLLYMHIVLLVNVQVIAHKSNHSPPQDAMVISPRYRTRFILRLLIARIIKYLCIPISCG